MSENKIQYRKLKHGREFFRIDGVESTKVLLKGHRAVVDHLQGAMAAADIIADERCVPCSEEEFYKAHADALTIVSMMKIP